MNKTYKGIDMIPSGGANDTITEGCLVLEGGAWKGLYTLGVLDAMMLEGINLRTTVGISAGALCGMGYVSGQIGWGARIDLTYRHDPNYCGAGAMRTDRGITGFSYLYRDILKALPLDMDRLMRPDRRFLVGATNMLTGELYYFEKGQCDLFQAVQASATVPYISKPVMINGIPYIDGGCADKIPYRWAKEHEQSKKIVVVKTREWEYRRKENGSRIARRVYKAYPSFVESLENTNRKFNIMTDELREESASGHVFVIAPSKRVTVSRFEGNMDKLGDLYWQGYYDLENQLIKLKTYLGIT